MNDGLIPHRYAKALYKLALDNNNADKVYEEMKDVVAAFESNPELCKVLSNPFVSSEDKSKLLLAAAGNRLEDDYRGFVKLILEKKREYLAYEMALAYRQIYRKANDISTVRIVTAVTLDDKTMEKLRGIVVNSFPSRKLEFTSQVDPSIIGGFVIDVDSVRMDASVSNELEKLRLTLLNSK